MKNEKVDFDKFAIQYDELLKESTSFFSDSEAYFAQYKVSIFKGEIKNKNPLKLLEFGCGTGRNIPYIQQAFPNSQIHGSDLSSASLEIASKRNPSVLFYKKGEVVQHKYECIFVAGVFHHISPVERKSTFQELHDLLEVGGELFVFEHNPYNPITRKIVSECIYDEDAVLLKPKELIKLSLGAKIKYKKHRYCLFIPPAFKFLTKLEGYLGKIPFGGQYWVHAIKLG